MDKRSNKSMLGFLPVLLHAPLDHSDDIRTFDRPLVVVSFQLHFPVRPRLLELAAQRVAHVQIALPFVAGNDKPNN